MFVINWVDLGQNLSCPSESYYKDPGRPWGPIVCPIGLVRNCLKNGEINFETLTKKTTEEVTLQISFYEATISLKPKPDKDITYKKDNYRSISLMNIDENILNKIVAI